MGDGRWEMGDGRWEMGDGRWEMGDGEEILNVEKRRRLVAVLDTSACEVARRAEGAGGATESMLNVGFFILDFRNLQLETCNPELRKAR
jgi:hypothetical protein